MANDSSVHDLPNEDVCPNDCESLNLEKSGYTWECSRYEMSLHRTVEADDVDRGEAFRCLPCLRATVRAQALEVNRLRMPRPLPSIPANLRQSIELIPTLSAPLDMSTRLELAINDICMAITPLLEHIASKDAEREILMGRIAKSDDARDIAVREMSAYARRCGELESQLCAQLVEHPGRKALLLVLAELRRAKLKHPVFAASLEQALVALASEQGELATAILKDDIDGEHGVTTEAAQVAAVAIRIIELVMSRPEVSA